MNKYVLVCWCDGEFDKPMFFDTKEEAIAAWHKDISEFADIPVEAVSNAYYGNKDFSDWIGSDGCGDGCFHGNDWATVNLNATTCDWQLFYIE